MTTASLQHYRTQTHSPEETIRLGEAIGHQAEPGTVIALTGNLGSGKTAFTQGLARGIGVDERYYVTSPTYTLINRYPGSHLTLYHIDLYRITSKDELLELGVEELLDQAALLAVEWADNLGRQLWSEDLKVNLEFVGVMNRSIQLTARGESGDRLIAGLF